MNCKAKTIFETENTVIFINENNSSRAVLSEGTETYLQFTKKEKFKWLLGTIIKICQNSILVQDSANQNIHRFLLGQLTGVSDKCPM